MRSIRMLCLIFSISMLLPASAHAQWTVFDPSNYATAVQEFHQLQQSYTTALQTRDQIITAYNLAYQMAQMPQDLAQRYKADFAQWTNVTSPNTYGNTSAWVDALNLGSPSRASTAFSSAVTALLAYPSGSLSSHDSGTQAIIKNQYATSEIGQGALTATLSTVGTIRADSETQAQKLTQLETDTYSTDPTQQTEMSVLAKINSATVMQVHSQQDTNQLLAAIAAQQSATQKQQIDTQNRALNQAIYFDQNFSTNMQKVTGGSSDALRTMKLSTSR